MIYLLIIIRGLAFILKSCKQRIYIIRDCILCLLYRWFIYI